MGLSWAEIESGIYGQPQLSNQARIISEKEMRLFELVTPGEDFYLGKQAGDTIGFRLVGRISGTATTALSEYQKIPMVKPPTYDAQATAARYGIAVPWTGLREDLDRLDVEDTVIATLREHSARTHNALIYNALVAGRSFSYVALTASSGNFTTGGPSGTAAADFSAFHARKIKLNMTKNNVPFADAESYHAVISPTMYMGMFADSTAVTGFVDVKKYAADGADGLLNGEIGKYMSTRYIEDNDALPDAIGSGSAFGSGFFCGFDACREVPVYPMRLLANLNLGGDFGQQKAIAWVSLLAYKTVWIHSTHGQGAVVHYTTA
jgi:N4-gp56 family major capsid protein